MEWLELPWRLLVARGVVGIVFGVMTMAWPSLTITVLVVLWGVWALLDAAGAFAAAVRAPGTATKLAIGLVGLVALAAGVVAVLRPFGTASVLTWFLGVWLIVRGVIELVAAARGRVPGSRVLAVVTGALSLLAGILLAANPGRGAVALAFWLGLVALLWGLVFLAAGLVARRLVRTLEAQAASTTA